MWAVLLGLSFLLAQGASEWMESLYRRERGILGFPAAECPSWRRPFLAAGFFLGALWLSGCSLSPGEFLARITLLFFLLLTICTDLEQHVIFDRMQLPFALLALPFFLLLDWQVLNHILAALAGGGIFLVLAGITRGGIGGGDIKLIFVLGLWLGAWKLFYIVQYGFLLSGVVAAVMLISGIWRHDQRLAYSPYFSAVAILYLLRA